MTDLPSSDKTLDTTCSSSSTTATPPDQPPPLQAPLSRNSSFSKLNAKAPEFVPMKTQSPPPGSLPVGPADPRILIVPPPSPPPPALVHVYPTSPLPMPIPVRAPAPFPPHLHHHDHQHHPQHRHSNTNTSNNQGVNNTNNNNNSVNNRQQKQHQDKKDHHQQQEGAKNDKDQGSGSSLSTNNNNSNNNGLSDEATQKLINQVEYYFSDVNLATTEHLIRFIFKDPEGFVPISVVASFKKIKALISSNSQLAAVLRNSIKLVVSEDGKKVKRLHGLSSSDMEELQARIIVAENLPEDHCHQNLMKIFSAVGSVKSIRTCQPQPSNNVASSASRSSKNDNMPYSNKLHAFVEYETVELAEKAIAELNDEDSWRNGLRVRALQKQVLKPAQGRTKRSGNESEANCEEEDVSTSDLNQNEKQSEDSTAETDGHSNEQGEEQILEKEGGQKKSRNRTRGKGRGRGHNHNHHHHQTGRGSHSMSSSANGEQSVVAKQQPPGPRMPDGTRGFSMGRGRPITVNTS